MLIREHSRRMYHPWIFFLVKMLISWIFLGAVSFLVVSIYLSLCALKSSLFMHYWWYAWLGSAASCSMAYIAGASAKSIDVAITFFTLLVLPQLLFAVLLKTSQIPKWLRWNFYIMPLKWTFGSVLALEFENNPDILNRYDYTMSDIWRYNLIAIGHLVGFAIIAMIALSWNGNPKYE